MFDMWTLDPTGQIGPLRIGMTEAEYTSILSGKPTPFQRTKLSPEMTLAFDQDLVHLGIDADRKISRIAVFRPREVSLAGVQLLGRPLNEVEADLEKKGLHFRREDAGLWDEKNRILLVEVEGMTDGVEIDRSSYRMKDQANA
jgi:hypothetical protein